jgi:predicted ATPase
VSKARLWVDRGLCDAGRDLLAPVYRSFSEGFDTPDLIEARALLDELTDGFPSLAGAAQRDASVRY